MAAPGFRPVALVRPACAGPILAAAFFAVSVERDALPRFSAKFGDRLSFRPDSKAEHPTGDRVSFCLHLEQSGRKGSAGVAIAGQRNESRTRRPSVKTIEPHQGHVNERTTGSMRLARYFRAAAPMRKLTVPQHRSGSRCGAKKKGAAAGRSLPGSFPAGDSRLSPLAYCCGGGAWFEGPCGVEFCGVPG